MLYAIQSRCDNAMCFTADTQRCRIRWMNGLLKHKRSSSGPLCIVKTLGPGKENSHYGIRNIRSCLLIFKSRHMTTGLEGVYGKQCAALKESNPILTTCCRISGGSLPKKLTDLTCASDLSRNSRICCTYADFRPSTVIGSVLVWFNRATRAPLKPVLGKFRRLSSAFRSGTLLDQFSILDS